MINRGIATILKELSLLMRDKVGISVLFAMPVMLIIIMTIVQHEAYKSLNDAGIPVLFVDYDQDTLGATIERGFSSSNLCKLTVDNGQIYPNEKAVKEAVLRGEFVAAMIIPKNATHMLRNNVGDIMEAIFEGASDTVANPQDIIHIPIIVDPVSRKSFVMAISYGLREFIANVKTGVIFAIMGERMQEYLPIEREMTLPQVDFFEFEEKYAIDAERYQPNAVQHNVPAWAIFAIFFITVPLAASIILERAEGLYIRMRALPGSYLSKLSGKLIVYVGVAMIQFILILLLGLYILPLMGLPELHVGEAYGALFGLALTISIAAVGYGLLLGTVFNTPPQSSIFGGVTILMMSALGGIWVPINIMPLSMQQIASFSPLNWGLSGFYELFLKEGTFASVWPEMVKLLVFFVICVFASVIIYRRKRKYQ